MATGALPPWRTCYVTARERGCVCMCVWGRSRDREESACLRLTEGENGNVIEKVEEVKEINRKREKVSRLCSRLRNYTSAQNLQRVVLTGARTELEVGTSERGEKKNLRDGGLPLRSRWRPGNHAPLKGGVIVHALWLRCVHSRVGRCEHSGVALGLHLPVCVYVRGIRRGPFSDDDDGDVQQLEFHRGCYCHIASIGHEAFDRPLKGEASVKPATFPTW